VRIEVGECALLRAANMPAPGLPLPPRCTGDGVRRLLLLLAPDPARMWAWN
jgi:hypothetical protein